MTTAGFLNRKGLLLMCILGLLDLLQASRIRACEPSTEHDGVGAGRIKKIGVLLESI